MRNIKNKVPRTFLKSKMGNLLRKRHMTNREFCNFVIYTPNWINTQKIEYDELFWTTKMVDKLKL